MCDELALEAGEALVRSERPGYLTQPRRRTGIHVVAVHGMQEVGNGTVAWGQVDVRSQVTGYLRRDEVTGAVWDRTPLDLPVRTLRTVGVWLTLDPTLVDESVSRARLGAGAHAAEHLLVSLLPLFAPCEIWDIGGVAALDHADTGGISVFVYDAVTGGAGFAERAYRVAGAWLAAAQRRIEACECTAGCPSCVVSASLWLGEPGLGQGGGPHAAGAARDYHATAGLER